MCPSHASLPNICHSFIRHCDFTRVIHNQIFRHLTWVALKQAFSKLPKGEKTSPVVVLDSVAPPHARAGAGPEPPPTMGPPSRETAGCCAPAVLHALLWCKAASQGARNMTPLPIGVCGGSPQPFLQVIGANFFPNSIRQRIADMRPWHASDLIPGKFLKQ
jgi:hypothetical protein